MLQHCFMKTTTDYRGLLIWTLKIYSLKLSLRPDNGSLGIEIGSRELDPVNPLSFDDPAESLALLVTSFNEDSVFWNHVFFEDCVSSIVALSWWSKSWFLHSDSTSASLVWASSNSSSRTSWSFSSSSACKELSELDSPATTGKLLIKCPSWVKNWLHVAHDWTSP